MTAYFDRFRRLKDRHGEDPKSKGAAAAVRQARISSSVVLGAMTVVMATLLVEQFSGPFAHLDTPRLAANMPTETVAPPPKADDVKIVSAEPRLDVPCNQQTWPYIDRRCLTESTKAPGKTPWRKEQDQKQAAVDLDPRNAPAVIPRVEPSTDGVASRDDEEQKPSASAPRQPAMVPVEPVRKGDEQPSIAASEPVQSSTGEQNETQRAAIIPIPVARPDSADIAAASRDADSANQPAPPKQTAVADEEGPQRAVEEEKPRKKRASRRSRDPGQRIVRRWRELTYDLPGGGSRRVMIFPPGMF